MPFKHGRGYWGWAPLHDGGRKRVPLGTDDRPTALKIEGMIRQLAGKRDWRLLEAAVQGPLTVGRLYDEWVQGEAALEALRARLDDIDLSEHVAAWKEWAHRRASRPTVAKYEAQLRVLIPVGAQYPRSSFTRKELNRALSSLSASGSTARRYHAAWSSFAKYLVEIEILEVNPLRSITPPRNNPPRDLYLELDDSVRLVEAQPEPYRALAALREGAGVEIAAALLVKRRDVDLARQTVHIRGTKNSWRNRPVFVDDWAWPHVVAAAKDKLPDAPLFQDSDGAPATYYRALAAHRGSVKALGLPPGYTMHDARHSFAVRCMKAGIGAEIIANNLGHRDATMVHRIYGKYRIRAEDFRRLRTGTGDT